MLFSLIASWNTLITSYHALRIIISRYHYVEKTHSPDTHMLSGQLPHHDPERGQVGSHPLHVDHFLAVLVFLLNKSNYDNNDNKDDGDYIFKKWE